MGYRYGVRYRPMRLIPTMTTSLGIVFVLKWGDLMCSDRTLWLLHRGVNRENYRKAPFQA